MPSNHVHTQLGGPAEDVWMLGLPSYLLVLPHELCDVGIFPFLHLMGLGSPPDLCIIPLRLHSPLPDRRQLPCLQPPLIAKSASLCLLEMSSG